MDVSIKLLFVLRSNIPKLAAITCAFFISINEVAWAQASEPNSSDCKNKPNILGVSRIWQIDANKTLRIGSYTGIGLKSGMYKYTRPALGPMEVILTFDDGPRRDTTIPILESLDKECVKATFFVLGRYADMMPDIVRMIQERGHTIGTHSWTHRKLNELPTEEAIADIKGGIESAQKALAKQGEAKPLIPFFRFPYNLDAPELLDWLGQNHIVAFTADFSNDDWTNRNPDQTLKYTLETLEKRRGGLILMHDIMPNTAVYLPKLLQALKERGFSIVHIVPSEN